MKYTISVRKNAEKDISDAFNWYEDQLEGLGEEFLKELESAYLRLENNPSAFTSINKELKQLILSKFPFVLVFETKQSSIIIYAVFHTHRNPDKKMKKR